MAITQSPQISWAAVTGAIKYEIYQKSIQPIDQDFTFIAAIDAPTTNYVVTGLSVDALDVFKVLAYKTYNAQGDGVLVDDPNNTQLVNFPNLSGAVYTTNSSTPDGQPAVVPVDVSYLTKDEFLLEPIAVGLGLSTSSAEYSNGMLDRLLLRASSHVNRYCGRYFQKQTIDETFPNVTIQVSNPRLTNIPLKYPPVRQINEVTIQVLTYFIPFSLQYLIQPFYEQHYYNIVPLLSTAGQGAPMGTGTPIPSVILEQSQLGIVWTNYTCGYDIIPEDIKYATALVAAKMYGMKFNPLGLTQFKTQTTMQTFTKAKGDNPIDSEAMKILDKYKIPTLRFT